MRIVILLIGVLFVQLSYAQEKPNAKWQAGIYYGIEEHDKRLYDHSEKEYLLALHEDEFWGTYSGGAYFSRIIPISQKLSVSAGLGGFYELKTFTRPFNHFYFTNGESKYILWHEDKYTKIYITLPISGSYNILGNFNIGFTILSNFDVYKRIENKSIANKGSDFPFQKTKLGFDSMELFVGGGVEVWKFNLNMKVRALNVQRVDKVIFNHIIDYPYPDKKWEWFNLSKLRFSLSYNL